MTTLAQILSEIRRRLRPAVPDEPQSAVTVLRYLQRRVSVRVVDVSVVPLGDSGRYYCEDGQTPRNIVVNPSVEMALEPYQMWRAGNAVGSIARVDDYAQAGIWARRLGIARWGKASLMVDMLGSKSAGDAIIAYYPAVGVVAGQRWQVSVYVYPLTLHQAQAVLLVSFRNAQQQWLSSYSVAQGQVVSGYTRLALTDMVVPNGAVWMHIDMQVVATGPGASATVFWDGLMAVRWEGSVVLAYLDGDRPYGWWQGEAHNSVTVGSGRAIIAGAFRAS